MVIFLSCGITRIISPLLSPGTRFYATFHLGSKPESHAWRFKTGQSTGKDRRLICGTSLSDFLRSPFICKVRCKTPLKFGPILFKFLSMDFDSLLQALKQVGNKFLFSHSSFAFAECANMVKSSTCSDSQMHR